MRAEWHLHGVSCHRYTVRLRFLRNGSTQSGWLKESLFWRQGSRPNDFRDYFLLKFFLLLTSFTFLLKNCHG